MMFSDIGVGHYLANSILWFLAGIGVGYVGRDVIHLVRSNDS